MKNVSLSFLYRSSDFFACSRIINFILDKLWPGLLKCSPVAFDGITLLTYWACSLILSFSGLLDSPMYITFSTFQDVNDVCSITINMFSYLPDTCHIVTVQKVTGNGKYFYAKDQTDMEKLFGYADCTKENFMEVSIYV